MDAGSPLTGFVTFGAGVDEDHGALTAMDRYFVDHWWEMVAPAVRDAGNVPRGRGEDGTAAFSAAVAYMPWARVLRLRPLLLPTRKGCTKHIRRTGEGSTKCESKVRQASLNGQMQGTST